MYLGELYEDCYKMFENDIKNLCYDPKSDDNAANPQIELDNLKEKCLSKVCVILLKYMFITIKFI